MILAILEAPAVLHLALEASRFKETVSSNRKEAKMAFVEHSSIGLALSDLRNHLCRPYPRAPPEVPAALLQSSLVGRNLEYGPSHNGGILRQEPLVVVQGSSQLPLSPLQGTESTSVYFCRCLSSWRAQRHVLNLLIFSTIYGQFHGEGLRKYWNTNRVSIAALIVIQVVLALESLARDARLCKLPEAAACAQDSIIWWTGSLLNHGLFLSSARPPSCHVVA